MRTVAILIVAILGACSAQVGARVAEPPVEAMTIPAPVRAGPELTVPRILPVPAPDPEPFAMNLFREGDFVPQHTFEWCVAASIQMTWNMARDPNRSSADDQGAVWRQARARSNDQWGGASGRGWARLLNEWEVGEYRLVSYPDYDEALRAAASAIRETELAVGLIVWRGRHAWVMSGFTAIGDPAVHDDFVVTGVNVLDPLYPHGDDVWGPSPEPNALLTPDELGRQFKARDRHAWGPDSPTGYVLVLPVAPQS